MSLFQRDNISILNIRHRFLGDGNSFGISCWTPVLLDKRSEEVNDRTSIQAGDHETDATRESKSTSKNVGLGEPPAHTIHACHDIHSSNTGGLKVPLDDKLHSDNGISWGPQPTESFACSGDSLAWDLTDWIQRPRWEQDVEPLGPMSKWRILSSRIDRSEERSKEYEDRAMLLDNSWDITCKSKHPDRYEVKSQDSLPLQAGDLEVELQESGLDASDMDLDTDKLHTHLNDLPRGIQAHDVMSTRQIATKDDLIPASDRRCGICGQSFTARRSLLRHVRSVREPKSLLCSDCKMTFVRKGTLDRLVAEKHSDRSNTVQCKACGRYIGKRAFHEHLDSEICRNSRSVATEIGIRLSVKFVGADDDPFLATLRMLKLFGPDVENRTIAYIRLRLRPECSQRMRILLRFEGLATKLMIDKLAQPKAATKSLGLAALLLGFMAVAGQANWNGEALMHFEGAARVFRAYHDSLCGCLHHKSFRLWSPFDPCNSEIGLLNRLLKDLGIQHKLLDAYTPEDEVARERQIMDMRVGSRRVRKKQNLLAGD